MVLSFRSVFCTDLRKDRDFCFVRHKLISFYNRCGKCLQRGTDWVFKYSGLRFVFKWLNKVALNVQYINITTTDPPQSQEIYA